MLWFTGSSTEGLPFIHASFRANPKAVHHKPKRHHHHQPQQHSNSSHPTNGNTTPRTVNPKDISKEVLELESFRLPAVDASIPSNGQLTSRSTGKVESSRDHVSFATYMHRYKACARLKGFSPSRVYCSTRTRPHPSDNHHDTDLPPPLLSPKDSLTTTSTIPQSNLSENGTCDPPKPDPAQGEASPAQLPDLAPQDSATLVSGTEVLEKQIEEKLKRDSSQDDGMVHTHRHGDRLTRGKGRGKGRRKGRKGGEGRGGSGGVGGRGGGQGGGRPLGDIVSPRRLQELLASEDERTLPYTYYQTSVDKDEAKLEDAEIESLD